MGWDGGTSGSVRELKGIKLSPETLSLSPAAVF